MKNITILLNELVNLRKVIHKKKPFKELKKELITITNDANDPTIIMVMGEFKAGKSTFINALLGEELLVSAVNPATAMITMLKYGETKRTEVVFKNGDKEEIDAYFFQNASAEGADIGDLLREKIDYLIVYFPNPLLKNMTLVDSPGLNSPISRHTSETKKFITRADDIIWLFKQGSVGRATEISEIEEFLLYGITPLGVMNSIDLHYEKTDENLDDYINSEKKKHQHLLKDLIGVSSLDAFQSVIENDPQKWEWSNFDVLLEKMQLMASDHTQKSNRFIIRLNNFFEKLYADLTYQMDQANYEYHSNLLVDFIEINQNALFTQMNKVNLSQKNLEFTNDSLNIFRKRVNSLSQLDSILNSKNLKGRFNFLSNQINFLYEKINEFESNVSTLDKISSKLHRDYYVTVGKGFTRYKHLFAKKNQINQLKSDINKFRKQYIHIVNLKTDLLNFQSSLKDILQRQIIQIEHTILEIRLLIKEEYESESSNMKATISNEHASIRPSLEIIEDHDYLSELLDSIDRIIKLNENETNDLQKRLVITLEKLSNIEEYSYVIKELKENETMLLDRLDPMPFTHELTYSLSDQIPLSICSEYKPKLPDIPTFNTTYLRPYSLIILAGLLFFIIFQLNIIPTITDKIGSFSIFDSTAVEVENDSITINYIGTVDINVDYMNIRHAPSLDSEVVGEASFGEQFDVYEMEDSWLRIGENQWISGKEAYVNFNPY